MMAYRLAVDVEVRFNHPRQHGLPSQVDSPRARPGILQGLLAAPHSHELSVIDRHCFGNRKVGRVFRIRCQNFAVIQHQIGFQPCGLPPGTIQEKNHR